MAIGSVGPEALARRVAAFGVGADGGTIRVSGPEWPEALERLAEERLSGLATALLRERRLVVPDGSIPELREVHRTAMLQALALERVLVRAAGAFERAGIELLVLKGPVLAAVYPDPSWRPFGDLDLMVGARDWDRSCRVLAEMGFGRVLPEPRSSFDVRFGKAATHRGEEGLEVDLHRTLVHGPFGLWMDPEELLRAAVPFSLGGVAVRRLDDTGLLLHACMHASLGRRPPSLLSVRDVAEVGRAAAVDWDLFADRVRRWRLGTVVRDALSTASGMLGAVLPPEAAPFVAAAPDPREVRAMRAYTSARRSRGGVALATLRAIPGLRGKASFLRALLVPDRAFLSARGRGGGYVRRWAVALRWLSARPAGSNGRDGSAVRPIYDERSSDRSGSSPTGASRHGRSSP